MARFDLPVEESCDDNPRPFPLLDTRLLPELFLPTVFLYLFAIGIWNYRFRPRHPRHMDARLSQVENAHPNDLDEEFDTFPTRLPGDVVRMRYDRLRSIAGRVQTVIGDLATQGERGMVIFIVFSLVFAVLLYMTPFSCDFWALLAPASSFEKEALSVPGNFYRRLPAKSDVLL